MYLKLVFEVMCFQKTWLIARDIWSTHFLSTGASVLFTHPEGSQGGAGSTGVSSQVRKGAVCELQERAVPWRYSVNHTREALIVTGASKNRNR